jgi:BirA family biotin operon repressor/biotin-[acetyl-CoA-carboxylase] ligase
VRRASRLDTTLKWPNDLLIGFGKLAGILAEQCGDAVVVGIGVNVSATRPELPVTGPLPATSLLLEGSASLDRDVLLAGILGEFERWYLRWRGAAGDPRASGLRAEYLGLCSTIGREVRAELPAGQAVRGTATGLGADGSLIVRTRDGQVTVGAGDLRHVR